MKKKIVAVDDSIMVLDWVTSCLSGQEIDVVAHESPFGVWRLVSEIKPDLVLLDVNMPGMGGRAVCDIIKKHLPLQRVVFYSSMPQAALAQLTIDARADGYIEKTNDGQLFGQQVKSHLRSGVPG